MKRSTIYTTGILLLFACSSLAFPSRSRDRTPDFARTLTLNLGQQARVMWVDATANIDRIKTPEGVHDIVEHCKKANITTIVLDVKPVVGEVLFNSKIATHLTSWKGKRYPDFDTLAAFVAECKEAGIELCTSFNVLGEGHKYFNRGLAYRKVDWQSVTYVVERALIAQDNARLPMRAETDPEDANKPTVHGDDFVVEPTPAAGNQLAVLLDGDRHVAGAIDPALLGDEPLVAPEDGRLLELSGPAMDWANQHIRAGDVTRYEAVGRRVPVTEASSEKIAAFINPLHPEARRYEINLMKEVARNYPVDGIVFDRMRYSNLYNDYSDITRAAFEQWLGKKLSRWPDDVIRFNPVPGEPPRRGRYYRQWLEFRARVIREFVREATEELRAVRPELVFGTYVGSWYTEYYGVGVNWGSDKFPVRAGWATPTYNETGIAEFLDWISTGCYYPIASRDEARALGREEGGTVEAAAELSMIAVANSVPVYAGLYALNYQGNPDGFARAISVACKKSQGVMIFDISYIYDYNWWGLLEQAFPQPSIPPHKNPGITSQLRTVLDAVRAFGDARSASERLPAVPYQPGGG